MRWSPARTEKFMQRILMKKRLIVWLVPLSLCVGAGCATELTAAGQDVRLGKAEPGNQCRELGIVQGSGGGGMYTSSGDKMQWAQNDLRNHTAEVGGNYVAMDVAGSDVRSLTLSGRAFACPPGGAAPAAPAATPAAPAPAVASPEERLRKLQELRDKGLITEQEYATRRKEILQSL